MKALLNKKEYVIITIFSIVFFLVFYGVNSLNPQNVDWLLAGGLDISQHYSGWAFFSKEGWRFPIGNFTGLSYPNDMSIIYMDSIPLLAVFFKLFQGVLPEYFQYFGWYQLLCFVLQGIFGVIILKKYIKDKNCLVVGAMLFVMAPIFLWRVFLHIALSSQWIILLALVSIVYYEEYFQRNRSRILFWMIIGFFCTTIHLYFLPMCFIIFCGFTIMGIRNKLKASELFLPLLSFMAGVVIPMLLLGGFMGGMSVTQEDIVWKKSFNLNGFINPQKWSPIIPNMTLHTYGQSEGFAYLGAGVLFGVVALMVIGGLHYREVRDSLKITSAKQNNLKLIVFGVIFILCIAAAVSPEITLGGRLLFTLPLPQVIENIWSIFRCCGRLVWPSVYLIMIAVCVLIYQLKNRRIALLLMLACVVIQGIDIAIEIWDRGELTRKEQVFESELKDNAWRYIGEHEDIENIVYVNVSGLSSSASMAEFADEYGLTLGKFYYARSYDEVTGVTAQDALEKKAKENLFLFDIYSVIDAWNEKDLFYYLIDGKLLGYCKPIAGLEDKQINVRDYEYNYTFGTAEGIPNVEMIDGFLFMHGGSALDSPEFQLPAGEYEIVIEGENLLDSVPEIISSERSQIDIHEMQRILGEVSCEETGTFRVSIENPSDHDMVLYQLKIIPKEK